MSHLTSVQLQQLRSQLEQEKKDIENHLNEAAATEEEQAGELSSYDNHPGDLGTETFEKARDMAIDESMEERLEQIEAALVRMDDGTYGHCEVSGEPIPFERLEAVPYTTRTVEHVDEAPINEERPPEEEVMTRPPAGAGEGRQAGSGRFDDAGAWETVEDYGNAK
ncbi:TraR/DksA C4-type zinc finger protein [Paenibacillus daejeonensis]|uniref:TraR/DksA C4-type zinc finger protein n=1 Tax=Paenibacillus daejeonensis TaxID=135193 RepID=UPI00037E16D7|nr:TraR/DksA C4-type zinc finger protein [Paenibacillus daejeonensis]